MRKTLILTFILLSNSCFASNFLAGSIYERIANEVGLDPLLLYSVSISESGFAPAHNKATLAVGRLFISRIFFCCVEERCGN